MPRRADPPPTPPVAAFTLPEDIREHLLRTQQEQIDTTQQLPRVKLMAAGVGLFDFGEDTPRLEEFPGVILGSHPRNVLWDRPVGANGPGGEMTGPACSSPDGITGYPRAGFSHPNLTRPAQPGDTVPCATCQYNQFGSGAALVPTRKAAGKAVTNQRSVYLLLADRVLPAGTHPAHHEHRPV